MRRTLLVGSLVAALSASPCYAESLSGDAKAEGLGVGEHGMEAYPGFVQATQEMRTEVV